MTASILSIIVYLLPMIVEYFTKDYYDVEQDFRSDVVKGNTTNVQRDVGKLLSRLRNRS